MVGVLPGREGAGDVADDLEEQADGEGDEPPAAEADDLGEVDGEEEGEPGGGKGGEGKGRGVAVDDDCDVPFSVGVGKVWVEVALGLLLCRRKSDVLDGELWS